MSVLIIYFFGGSGLAERPIIEPHRAAQATVVLAEARELIQLLALLAQ